MVDYLLKGTKRPIYDAVMIKYLTQVPLKLQYKCVGLLEKLPLYTSQSLQWQTLTIVAYNWLSVRLIYRLISLNSTYIIAHLEKRSFTLFIHSLRRWRHIIYYGCVLKGFWSGIEALKHQRKKWRGLYWNVMSVKRLLFTYETHI